MSEVPKNPNDWDNYYEGWQKAKRRAIRHGLAAYEQGLHAVAKLIASGVDIKFIVKEKTRQSIRNSKKLDLL